MIFPKKNMMNYSPSSIILPWRGKPSWRLVDFFRKNPVTTWRRLDLSTCKGSSHPSSKVKSTESMAIFLRHETRHRISLPKKWLVGEVGGLKKCWKSSFWKIWLRHSGYFTIISISRMVSWGVHVVTQDMAISYNYLLGGWKSTLGKRLEIVT